MLFSVWKDNNITYVKMYPSRLPYLYEISFCREVGNHVAETPSCDLHSSFFDGLLLLKKDTLST